MTKGYRLTAVHRHPQGRPRIPAGPGRPDQPSARQRLRAGRRGRRHGRAQRRAQGLRPGDDDGQAAVRALRARPATTPPSMLKQLVEEAHIVIKLTAISAEQEPHSTLAAFLINPGGDCHWVHAGDSRIYHFHGGQLVKRTMDHSYVQTLVDRGEITEEEANVHPQSNILMGCLGTEDDAAGRHPPHPAAAARRRADGLQRRRLALLQPERTGLGAVRAVAARSHRVPDGEGPLARARRRRQPVAGDREAGAAAPSSEAARGSGAAALRAASATVAAAGGFGAFCALRRSGVGLAPRRGLAASSLVLAALRWRLRRALLRAAACVSAWCRCLSRALGACGFLLPSAARLRAVARRAARAPALLRWRLRAACCGCCARLLRPFGRALLLEPLRAAPPPRRLRSASLSATSCRCKSAMASRAGARRLRCRQSSTANFW